LAETPENSEGFPFGVYFCLNCRTLVMWYPDIVKHPDMNLYPENIKCPTCKTFLHPKEKLLIKDIWTDLVPLFLETTKKYAFIKAIICDEEHCHLVWTKAQINR